MATKIGLFAQELSQTNTWWRTAGWWKHDPDLRDAQRLDLGYDAQCLADLASGGLYILRGPRRVGKTVAVKQAIRSLIDSGTDPRAIVAASADGWSDKDLRSLTQNAALPRLPDGMNRWWFIDEVTAIKGDWPAQIKWLRDNDTAFRSATVVLTGSNARGLSEAIGLLAGRRGPVARPDRSLFPMGFKTFAGLLDVDLPKVEPIDLARLESDHMANQCADLLPYLDGLVRSWELYLINGGFPIAVAATRNGEPVPPHFVESLFDVVQRDAFIRSSLSESMTTALLDRLAEGLCSPFNLSNAARDVDLSPDTLARRVGDLQDAYLLWSCPQSSSDSWAPRHGSMSKLYFVDPIHARLAHHRNAGYQPPDPTALVEQLGLQLGDGHESLAPTW